MTTFSFDPSLCPSKMGRGSGKQRGVKNEAILQNDGSQRGDGPVCLRAHRIDGSRGRHCRNNSVKFLAARLQRDNRQSSYSLDQL